MVSTDRSQRASVALKNLPPLPIVAAKVSELLDSEPTSFQEVAELLESDAALSAEVLRLANSPLMSVRYGVGTVLQALAILGSRRVATLVMTLAFSKILKRAGKTQAMRRLWRHNLATALAARRLAEELRRDASQAYYAGLFHDIGRLALLLQQPALYDQALAARADVDEMERQNFGLDHCEAGVWVVEKWKLPEDFMEVALDHHHPKEGASELTVLVHEACAMADRLGFSFLPVESGEELGPADETGFAIALAVNSLESELGI
jgi:putative nucleotidyltransferase with HDIG domain